MATFVFRAVDLAGVAARGEVDAETKQAVTDQLKARGLIVLDINAKKGSKEITLEFLERVKARDLTVMTRQLATMVTSGMTILRALYVLEEQTESKLLKRALVHDPQGRRGRPAAVRRARAAPQDLQPAVRRDGARRRDRRRARERR